MKLTVKTLKGVKFEVEVEDSNSVSEVKTIIEKDKPELPAAGMKLIHSGKVLKDTDVISTCGIKPNDFLVVMVTKAKKAAAPAPAAAPAAAPATPAAPAAVSTARAAPDASSTPAAAASASATTTTAATTASSGASDAAPSQPDDLPAEAIANLTSMGFPEAEVRHCLRAADGNPDVAVEFLTNGIPETVAATMSRTNNTSGTPSATRRAGSEPLLQALRDHPQFNDLRRLVQSNPQMLQQVLTQIGQQQPELLQEINANQALFLQMMNEPVDAPAPSSSTSAPAASTGTRSSASGVGGPAAGLGSPSQMAQMIQNMSAEEVNQMAAMMGISPDQLRQTAQVIGQMPPEQINQFMMQAMGGGGADQHGLAGLMGGLGGRQLIVELTEEEMQAVDRLAEMGFDRAEAAQAFLACDKNEALAANLLMDSMDGGGFYGGGGDNNDNGGGDGNGNANDDDDDMYD